MKFKAAIFDLDGTLISTEEDIRDAANSVLRNFGYPEHDLLTIKGFVGEGLRALMIKALPESERHKENIQRCCEQFKSEYANCWTNKSHPYPGIPELLDGLVNSDISIAILSNKADFATQEIGAQLLSRWPFSIILGATAGNPCKPDPNAALIIAKQLAIAADEFIFLGDTSIDMQTADAAGMYGIGVLWGFRPAEEMIAGGARILLREPQDLMPWL